MLFQPASFSDILFYWTISVDSCSSRSKLSGRSSSIRALSKGRMLRLEIPQNFFGIIFFWLAVNLHPMWLWHPWQWAMVQAYLFLKDDVKLYYTFCETRYSIFTQETNCAQWKRCPPNRVLLLCATWGSRGRSHAGWRKRTGVLLDSWKIYRLV